MVKVGNSDVSFKVGSDDVDAIYLGNTLVYSGGTPPTPPAFQGKWLATYTSGTTSSAECDATSAITSGEINRTNLVTVEIGDCVTSIDYIAFLNCTSLTSCTIGNGVTSIGETAFGHCTGLTSITINATVPPSVGWSTFDFDGSYPIYVPSESVEAYKTASVWSIYASRIQAIPNS